MRKTRVKLFVNKQTKVYLVAENLSENILSCILLLKTVIFKKETVDIQ